MVLNFDIWQIAYMYEYSLAARESTKNQTGES